MFNSPNTLQMDGAVDPQKVLMAFAELVAKAGGQSLQKTATGSPSGPYVHGNGGLFGVRGLSRDIISTHTQITGSLGETLPIRASNETNPLFPYITGFVRSDTQEKNGICDDPEEAGNFKTCLQTTIFGRKEFKSREFELSGTGKVINRGEFNDLQIINSPLVNEMGGLMQNVFPNLNGDGALAVGREMMIRMIEVGVAFQRWYCPIVYTGNPANSSAGGGYKEPMGLQMLIGTNKIDAQTGAACPSLYSDVKNFQYARVDSSTDPDIYRVLSTMMYILERKAIQQNMAPAEFALVMRPQLFWELSRFWPQKYNTDGATLTNAGLDMLILQNVQIRDAMRAGQYLTINSKNYRVILDDCIMEENRADNAAIPISGFSSDIYIVPLTVRNRQYQTLYWEYFDFQNQVLPQMQGLPKWFWSDGGAFLWTMGAPKNWCLDVTAQTQPRLILRTPQLAGRLQNVVYVPLQHTDDPLPSQDYHLNGGVKTGRPFASPFSEWNPSGPGVPS